MPLEENAGLHLCVVAKGGGLSRTMEFKNVLIVMFIIILAVGRGQPISSKQTIRCLLLRDGCIPKSAACFAKMLLEENAGLHLCVVAKGGGDRGGERAGAM
nr:hypothetical protein [Tanacetum cinerariifolium]